MEKCSVPNLKITPNLINIKNPKKKNIFTVFGLYEYLHMFKCKSCKILMVYYYTQRSKLHCFSMSDIFKCDLSM